MMMKLMISLTAVLSLVTVTGCKKKGGGSDALAKMEGFSKDMCACKDKACADKVQADMTKWGTEMAKNAKADAKPDPDLAKKSADVMTKYTECMTKLMMAGGPDMKGSDAGSAKQPPPPDNKGSAAPTAGSAAPKEPHKAPAWLSTVPAQATTAKVGQMAWVIHGDAFDSADGARVHIEEVIAIDGKTATTRPLALMASGADAWKHKPEPGERPYAGLPGMLVIPARTVDEVKPKPDDIVFAFMGNTPTPHLARVKSVEGGLVTYEVPNAMGTKLEEKKTDLIEPYGKGVAPFTFVAYKDGAEWKSITVLAIAGDKVFGYNSAGKLVETKKAGVKPLKPEFKDRKAGDKVFTFHYGTGAAGEVKEVVVPKYIFKVGIPSMTWHDIFDKAP